MNYLVWCRAILRSRWRIPTANDYELFYRTLIKPWWFLHKFQRSIALFYSVSIEGVRTISLTNSAAKQTTLLMNSNKSKFILPNINQRFLQPPSNAILVLSEITFPVEISARGHRPGRPNCSKKRSPPELWRSSAYATCVKAGRPWFRRRASPRMWCVGKFLQF